MFCQQPPHLLRPNKRLTRIKKGGHPLVTYNKKRFKNFTFAYGHGWSYPIWLPKTKKKDTSQKMMLFVKSRKICKHVCLSRTFMIFSLYTIETLLHYVYLKNGEIGRWFCMIAFFWKKAWYKMSKCNCHPVYFFHHVCCLTVCLDCSRFLTIPFITSTPIGTHSTKATHHTAKLGPIGSEYIAPAREWIDIY